MENTAIATKNFNVDVIAIHNNGPKIDWYIMRGSRTFGRGTARGYKAAQQQATDYVASRGWKIRQSESVN